MAGNKPTQLERMRRDLQDKFFARNPVLAERLTPLLSRAETISEFYGLEETEPLQPKGINVQAVRKDKEKLIKELNKMSQEEKTSEAKLLRKEGKKKMKFKKVTDVPPAVLWNLR